MISAEEPARKRIGRVVPIFFALFLAGYAALLASLVGAYPGGSDSSGYFNHAKLLSSGTVFAEPRVIPELAKADTPPWLYIPLGFRPAPDGERLVPTYPAGLPLFIAAAAALVGWDQAGNVVAVLHGVLGVWLTYLLARTAGLSPRWSFFAAFVIAASPLYLHMALQAMSDVPSLVWVTATLVAALRSQDRPNWSLAAGAAFGIAVLLRPTDLLVLAAMVPAFRVDWGRWLLFAVGALPFGIFYLVHARLAYGEFLTTGYGSSTAVALEHLGPTLLHYAEWLPLLFTPVVIAFLALPFLRPRDRNAQVLTCVVLAIGGFYAFYQFTSETWWYLRFVLPIAPALVGGGLMVLQSAVRPRVSSSVAPFALACAALATLATDLYGIRRLHAASGADLGRDYKEAMVWVEAQVAPDGVVAAMLHSGSILYYTNLAFVRWDSLDPASFRRLVQASERAGRPLYAALFAFEEPRAFAAMPGRWTNLGTFSSTTLWRWDAKQDARSGPTS